MTKIRIALAQLGSELGNKAVNVTKTIETIEKASSKGANIVCFPELFISGYNLEKMKDGLDELSDTLSGDTLTQIRAAAKDNEIYVIIGLILKKDNSEGLKNTAILIDNKGEIMGKYSKNHMFGEEGDFFQRDNLYPVFDTEFGRIGIAICYDINFPETVRTLTISGADIIFVPAAWRVQDDTKWETLTNSRALENTVFLAAVNQYVEYDNLLLFGHSKIVNPVGETLIESTQKGDELLIQEIDLGDLEQMRKENPYLKDRQIQGYSKIMENRK